MDGVLLLLLKMLGPTRSALLTEIAWATGTGRAWQGLRGPPALPLGALG